MGTIVPPKEGVKELKINVETPSHTFLCTIHESVDMKTIYLGGLHKYCIKLQAFKPGSVYERSGLDITIATMPELKYEGTYRRKIDTDYIFKLGISILQSISKWVKKLKFTDTSHRTCSNGTTVELPFMNYILYEKTWYERTFGAYLEKSDQVLFNDVAKKFQELKQTLSWEIVQAMLQTPESIVCEKETLYLRDLYRTSKTWSEFFLPIYECMGRNTFCEFVSPFLHIFQTEYMKYSFSSSYYIDLEPPHFVPIKIHATEFKKHTRQTRKNMRVYKFADAEVD